MIRRSFFLQSCSFVWNLYFGDGTGTNTGGGNMTHLYHCNLCIIEVCSNINNKFKLNNRFKWHDMV